MFKNILEEKEEEEDKERIKEKVEYIFACSSGYVHHSKHNLCFGRFLKE